jgi:mRNA-degrading endonuclease toxin of MazEF toxin-antitoxin module
LTAPVKPGALRRGYVYLARLDKLRPVLVISPNVRNELASDVIVIPCSTRLSAAPTHVRLRRGEGGVSEACVLKCEQIATLHRDDVRRQPLGGALPAEKVLEVERAVLRAIGVPVPLE